MQEERCRRAIHSGAWSSRRRPRSPSSFSFIRRRPRTSRQLAWVNAYGGTRVFGTTLGHGNETWQDPVFPDLLVRGFEWAINREPSATIEPAAIR